MEQSKVRENIKSKYRLYDGQRITVEALIKLAEVENMELQDLLFVLGGYKNAKYKEKDLWTTIGKKKSYNKRDVINLIKIDLKYLHQYGSRMYSKLEIDDICREYNVSLEDFLTYIYNYKICYYENMYILSMNKEGLWIGKNIGLSVEFLNRNYKRICNKIEKMANRMVELYDSNISKEELIDTGINCVLQHGKVEKNLSFDESGTVGKLLFKARYKMLETIVKSYNEKSLEDVMDFIKIEDNINLGNRIENWLYPIKLKRVENLIIENIQLNIEKIIEDRKQGLEQVNDKLNMEQEKFYKNIDNIAQKLINQNKVRLCSDGRVVIVNE